MRNFTILIFCLLFLSACAGHKQLTPKSEMFAGPSFIDKPDYLTAVRLKPNPVLFVSDAYFVPDMGIAPSKSWRFVSVPSDATDMKDAQINWTVADNFRGELVFLAMIGKPLSSQGDRIAFQVDHAGKRIVNRFGQMIWVEDWRKINPQDFYLDEKEEKELHDKILSEVPEVVKTELSEEEIEADIEKIMNRSRYIEKISRMRPLEAKRGSALYEELFAFSAEYTNDMSKRWQVVEHLRDEAIANYGFNPKLGITREVQKLLLRDEDFIRKLIAFLGDDWQFAVSITNPSASVTVFNLVAMKVFGVGSLFKPNLDKYGYMDRTPTAMEVVEMIRVYNEYFGFSSKHKDFLDSLMVNVARRNKEMMTTEEVNLQKHMKEVRKYKRLIEEAKRKKQ